MTQTARLLAGLLGVIALAGPASADTPVEIWDTRLNVKHGTLQGVSETMVTYFDEGRAYQSHSRDSLVRLRVLTKAPTAAQGADAVEPQSQRMTGQDVRGDAGGGVGENAAAAPQAAAQKAGDAKLEGPGWLWLTDGQKIKATLTGPAAGEVMRFTSERLGAITVPVDKVARFWPDALPDALTSVEGQDMLLLANGDRVVGFIETLDEGGYKFKPQGAEASVQLGAAQVAGFYLSNPARMDTKGLTVFTLVSGEVLGASSLTVADDKARMMLSPIGRQGGSSGEPVELLLADVSMIDFSGPGGRLVPLRDVARQSIKGEEFLGTPNKPIETAQGLLTQAPVTVRFQLPAGSSRLVFNGSAWTPKGSEEQARKWTRFDAAIVLAGEKIPVWTMTFSYGKQEHVMINVLPGPMDLVLDEGPDGPVLDKFLMSDAYLLVKPVN